MYAKCVALVSLVVEISAVVVLDKFEWTVHNANQSIQIPAQVPGGIYTDLQNAGVIGDVFYRFNDVETRWVARDTWTYDGKFTVSLDQLNHEVANLVLHGVDTVAFLEVNGNAVGTTNNMFVRYVFNIRKLLKEGENTIRVAFESPIRAAQTRSQQHFTAPDCVPDEYHGECHANQLRKMQASFAWDWGPAVPSVGLWKPVEIEFYNSAIIRSVTTRMRKRGSKSGANWSLLLNVFLEVNDHIKLWEGLVEAKLTVEGPQTISVSQHVEAPVTDGVAEVKLSLVVSENVIREWWPNGYGAQPLYKLLVTASSWGEEVTKSLRVAFRTIEVVEEDASIRLGNTTAGQGLTFYFKINGYPIFMKGSNWIPASILPELGYVNETISGTLEAAKDSNMNMLRVWGGGVYESDLFYDQCDELGILIWQDFMFACSMYPVDKDFMDSVRTEVEQNVKRLQHHASIAVWAGNNENEAALRDNWYHTASKFDEYKHNYIKLYVDTIKPIVNYLDPDRRYLVSSPSNGKKSEQDGYISMNPYDSHYGDTHYYNYIADVWDMNIYPLTRFASEYGFQSYPTLLTYESATNVSEDFRMDSEFNQHRQHSPSGYQSVLNQITKHLKFGKCNYCLQPVSEEDDYTMFKKFVLYSQIVQAMAIKAETEFYRQSQESWYTMGALYWQLNDVWQAPSWSSIDYQRRWKILQYFAVRFFAPVLVSPRLQSSGHLDIYLLNDRFVPIVDAQIKVDLYSWSSLVPLNSTTFVAQAEPLSAKKQDVYMDFWQGHNKEEVLLKFWLTAEGVAWTPHNYVFPKPLKSIKGLKKPNITLTVSRTSSEPNSYKYRIDITVDTIVLFLWLETPPILHSYFEDNGLVITTPYFSTNYVSTIDVTPQELKDMITIQYYYEE